MADDDARSPSPRSSSKLPSPFLDDPPLRPVPRRRRLPPWLWAYIPLLIWVAVSILTAVVVGVWHTEVFEALETFSRHMKAAGLSGYAIFFACIAFTCIPPCPFYGTLIILAGYTYGVPRGFAVSYFAALSGAIAVYLASRMFFRESMIRMLKCSPGMRKTINAISHRPRLLFLIRLAPYPYNLVNSGCAASDKLKFSTYFWCTALALPKLAVHCAIGASIRSWIHYNSEMAAEASAMDEQGRRLKTIFGGIGIGLCVIVFLWLFFVARRAIDEADEDDVSPEIKSLKGGNVSPLLMVQVERPR